MFCVPCSTTRVPTLSPEKIWAAAEQERVQARVLELHQLSGVSLDAIAAHEDVKKGNRQFRQTTFLLFFYHFQLRALSSFSCKERASNLSEEAHMKLLQAQMLFGAVFQSQCVLNRLFYSIFPLYRNVSPQGYPVPEDGAAIHCSRSTKAWLQINHTRLFNADNCPLVAPI